MEPKIGNALIAEFLGTFTLVFVGVAAVASAQGVVVAALAHGLILVGLIYSYRELSGANFNPAVTLGLLVGGKIPLPRALGYIVVQFLGGLVGAALGVVVTGGFGETTGSLTMTQIWNAALFEAIMTFLLVTAVYQAAVYSSDGNLAGVAIGFTLGACILAGGTYTGASLNPARTLGPAIMAQQLDYVLPYLLGIFGGGALAGVVHGYILRK
ncbi:MAG: aquaporin [Armatimonadetes bacterium]|nr:aquaporin [Anaerolineae bacterium]